MSEQVRPSDRSLAAWTVHLGAGRRLPSASAVRRWLARGRIDRLAGVTAARRPSDEAFRIDGRALTHGALGVAADSVARELVARGVVAGDRVLLGVPSSLEMVAAYLGILRAGCTAVLVNPSLTPSEIEHLVEDSEPVLGVVSPAVRDGLGELAGGVAAVVAGVLPPGGDPLLLAGLGAVENSHWARPVTHASTHAPNVLPGGPAAVLAYTSGSTGRPKGAPLSHANLLATCRGVMSAWRWSADDVTVHCLPLFHLHGLSSLHAVFLGGGRAVIESRLDPGHLAHLVRTEEASILLGVPAVHRRLVGEASDRHEDFTSLRLVISGSAPLPPSLAAEVEALTGHAALERYGTTESGLDVSNPYHGERRPGSVGLALPGIEVRIAGPDGERGADAPEGEDGEILVRGPHVFAGYWRRPREESGCVDGGWWRTGDIGRIEPADGYLSITGRAKELIITGGLNVYPREVEAAIEHHAAVQAVAVAGVPSERWGEEVTAFVVLRPGMSAAPDELAAACSGRLAPYKRPKRIVIVDELPTNALGKVRRDVLAASLSGSEDDLG